MNQNKKWFWHNLSSLFIITIRYKVDNHFNIFMRAYPCSYRSSDMIFFMLIHQNLGSKINLNSFQMSTNHFFLLAISPSSVSRKKSHLKTNFWTGRLINSKFLMPTLYWKGWWLYSKAYESNQEYPISSYTLQIKHHRSVDRHYKMLLQRAQ